MLLMLSFPPTNWYLLSAVALVPTLVALQSASIREWSFAGLLVGATAHIGAPGALVAWNIELIVAPWAVTCGLFAAFFACVSLISRWTRPNLRIYVLPACWPPFATLTQLVFEIPLSFTAGFALSESRVLSIISFLGIGGLDLFALLASGLIAGLFVRSVRPITVLFWLAVSILLIVAADRVRSGWIQLEGSTPIHLLQPSTTLAEQQRSRNSLMYRTRRVKVLDSLTNRAIEKEPGLIVWPEGGNGMHNLRVPARRQALLHASSKSDSTLLIATLDKTPDNLEYNLVAQVERGEIVDTAAKANTVKFSEEGIQEGSPHVLASRNGKVGISICFDSLFSSHAVRLRDLGAEVLVVTSNDSSFGLTALPYWHLAYSVLNAVEVMRPVAFLSNRGPSMVVSQDGKVILSELFGVRSGIISSQIPLVSDTRPRWLDHLKYATFLPLAILFILLRVKALSP